MYTGALDLRIHTWRATERRLHFDSPSRTRVRLSVSKMVIVCVFSVWIRRLRPIFPLSQVELCLAVRER